MSEAPNKGKPHARQKHGWFASRPHNYAELIKHPLVADWIKRYRKGESQESYMRGLQRTFEDSGVGVDDFFALSPTKAKATVLSVADTIRETGKYAEARKVIIATKSWLEFHKKRFAEMPDTVVVPPSFELDNLEKKKYYEIPRKKIAYEVIPNRDQVYRMADASLTLKASLRNRAMILSLFQSGVRENCLCRWTYSMFKDQLWPTVKVPVKLVITAEMDTKLHSYGLGYYITFLQREAAEALKTYLEYRIRRGWEPQADDPVFVTESTASQDEPLETRNIWEVIKQAQVTEAAGIELRGMWARLLRKAFNKVLNASDIDADTKESIMGHKLPGSRGNYFDAHDHDEIAAKYMRVQFDRVVAAVSDPLTTGLHKIDAIRDPKTAREKLTPEEKTAVTHFYRELLDVTDRTLDISDIIRIKQQQASGTSPLQQRRTRSTEPKRARTARNGGTPLPMFETRIVDEEQLVPLLNQGFDVLRELSNGRIVVRRPLNDEAVSVEA